MTISPALVMVSSSREWSRNLSSHCAAHGGAEICQVILDIEDIDVPWHALLVDDTFAYINPPLVHRLRGDDRVVIGFCDPHLGTAGKDRLERELGMDAALDSDASGPDIVATIERCLLQRTADRPRAAPVDEQTPHDSKAHTQSGDDKSIIVTTGSGSTELAVALAKALAGNREVLLVDGDTVNPGLAPRLALRPGSDGVNIHGAVDAIHRGVTFSVSTGRFSFDVVPGIAHHSDWSVYPASDLVMAVETLAGAYDLVIVDIDEGLEQLGLFGESEDRFGVSRMLLRRANDVVLGIDPNPLGVLRGLQWCAMAVPLSSARIHIAVNRFRGDSHQSAQLVREFSRTFRPASFTLVPDDRRVDRAVWTGETVPRGSYTKAVDRIASQVRAAAAERQEVRL